MKPSAKVFPAVFLLLASACGTSPSDRNHPVYAPRVEGLTLAYENPSLEGDARADSRLQVRVDSMRPMAGGASGDCTGEVRRTRLKGEETMAFEIKDGGLKAFDDQRRPTIVLPEGFPIRTTAWEDGGTRNRILGRATNARFDKLLPKDASKVGIWVESSPVSGEGPRLRTFLLPDIGSAEVLVWKDGQWIPTVRLVGRGFTDSKQKPPSTPALARGKK